MIRFTGFPRHRTHCGLYALAPLLRPRLYFRRIEAPAKGPTGNNT